MYNKLFTKILDSSIWLEDHATRIVWMTMLASMDEEGMCQFASVANLARRAVVTPAEARAALDVLEEPDSDSSDPDNDGRRVERVPGGWIVANAVKYREQVSREESKRLTRERVRRFREKKNNVTPVTNDVTPNRYQSAKCNGSETQSEAEANTEAETSLSKTSSSHPVAPLGKHPDLLIYEAYPRREGKRKALEAIGKAVARLVKGEAPRPAMQKIAAQRRLYAHTLAYARSPAGQNPDRSMIPHPSTWFNQSRYDDDQTNWQHTGGTTHGKPSRIDAITESSRAALAILDGVDDVTHRNGGSTHAIAAPRSIFESADDSLVAQNPGGGR